MINTSIQNNDNSNKMSRVLISPKKHQDNQSDTSELVLKLKRQKKKSAMSEKIDSHIDIGIEKSPRKTSKNFESPIVKTESTNNDKSIANKGK